MSDRSLARAFVVLSLLACSSGRPSSAPSSPSSPSSRTSGIESNPDDSALCTNGTLVLPAASCVSGMRSLTLGLLDAADRSFSECSTNDAFARLGDDLVDWREKGDVARYIDRLRVTASQSAQTTFSEYSVRFLLGLALLRAGADGRQALAEFRAACAIAMLPSPRMAFTPWTVHACELTPPEDGPTIQYRLVTRLCGYRPEVDRTMNRAWPLP